MAGTHRIKKLEVELQLPDQQEVRALQQEVSSFCRTELQPILQEAFDAVAPESCLRIDRLELDLQSFTSADDFRNRLKERIIEVLDRQLDEARIESFGVGSSAARLPVTAGEDLPLTFDAPYLAADLFIHVLTSGVAPWHAMAMDYDIVVAEIITLVKANQPLRTKVSAVLSDSDQALRRFILQTSTFDRRRILSVLTGVDEELTTEIEQLLDTFVDILSRGMGMVFHPGLLVKEIFAKKILRTRTIDDGVLASIFEEVIVTVINATGDDTRRRVNTLPLAAMELETLVPERFRSVIRDTFSLFAEQATARGGEGAPVSDRELIENMGALPGANEIDDLTLRTVKSKSAESSIQHDSDAEGSEGLAGRVIAQDGAEEESTGDVPITVSEGSRQSEKMVDNETGLQEKSVERPPLSSSSDIALPEQQETKTEPSGSSGQGEISESIPWLTPSSTDEFHITNAGLVLVAPFFGTVFKDLGYLDEKREFLSEKLRTRAVHFSQFLVTGEQHSAECGLMLNKILCNMNVEEPLERFIDLTEQELGAAEEVLDSALQHWTVLKKTTAPVFQQTFLQHEGILKKEGSWLLRIERTSVDVLIDTLPWTISIIKHPWMKQAIMVEW